MAIPAGMEEFLNRKYAILQQQADAGTTQATAQAAATTRNAGSTALLAQAGARFDNTRSDLMPAESAAMIAQRQAETALTGETTRWYGSEAAARIGNLEANTDYTTTQDMVAQREGLHDFGPDGTTRFSQYRLPNSAPRPRRRTVAVPAPLRTGQSLFGGVPTMRSTSPNIIDFSDAPEEAADPGGSAGLRTLNAYGSRRLR